MRKGKKYLVRQECRQGKQAGNQGSKQAGEQLSRQKLEKLSRQAGRE